MRLFGTVACALLLAGRTSLAEEGPVWCGTRVASPGSGVLVVVDTTTNAVTQAVLAADPSTIGWSPSCDRIAAVVGARAGVVDVATMTFTDFGPPASPLDISYPGSYGRAGFHSWPHGSVAWSRSGAHFVVRARGGNTRASDALVLYETATHSARTLALPAGEVDAFAMTSESDVVAVVNTAPGANGDSVVVAGGPAAVRTIAGPYALAVLGQQDPPVVIAMSAAHALVGVDPATGAERPIAPSGIRYLVGVSRDGTAALTYSETGPGPYAYVAASMSIASGATRVRAATADVGADADFAAWARDGTFAVDTTRSAAGSQVVTWLGPGGVTHPIADLKVLFPGESVGMRSLSMSLDGSLVAFVESHPVKGVPRKAGCDYYGVVEKRLGMVRVSGAGYWTLASLGHQEMCGIE